MAMGDFGYLVPVLLVAVLGVLIVGVLGMVKGGEFNRKYGNKLMRARVILQFMAVMVLLVIMFTRS